jgi:hypothetical protein
MVKYRHTPTRVESKLHDAFDLMSTPVLYSIPGKTPFLPELMFIEWAAVIPAHKIVIQVAPCYRGCPKHFPEDRGWTDAQRQAADHDRRLIELFRPRTDWVLVWIWEHLILERTSKSIALYIETVIKNVVTDRLHSQ